MAEYDVLLGDDARESTDTPRATVREAVDQLKCASPPMKLGSGTADR